MRMKRWYAGALFLIMILISGMSQAENSIAVGKKTTFGKYRQNMTSANVPKDPEPINWIVLDVEDSKALLLAEQPLVGKPFNDDDHFLYETTWESCSLRTWLNSEFLNDAFSAEEQRAIQQTKISTPDNKYFPVSGGNGTEDKVFLLSTEELGTYLKTNSARQCAPTDYAIFTGVSDIWGSYSDDSKYISSYTNGVCIWWLRSPGSIGHYTACCSWNGEIREDGVYSGGYVEDGKVKSNVYGVRPAIWVSVSALPGSR